MEYYYNKSSKKWCIIDFEDDEVSPEKLEDLRKNRNKKFLKVCNRRRYKLKYSYIDLDDVKLILNNGKKLYICYRYTSNFSGCTNRSVINSKDICNPEIIKNIVEDCKFAKDYVYIVMETLASDEIRRNVSIEYFIKNLNKYKSKYKESYISILLELSDSARLYYELNN